MTPSRTTAPPATSTAVSAGPVAPRVTLSKAKSKYNGPVEVELAGFTPKSQVTVRWADGAVLATAPVAGDGRAMAAFRTPLVAYGTYRVEARDESGLAAYAQLSVIPRILLNEVEGPTSTRLRVYFYGFSPGERVELRWYTADESSYTVLATVAIASNGRGSSLVTLPAKSTLGPHKMGRVIGVRRSASTTFTVTSGGVRAAGVVEPTAFAPPSVAATVSPTPTVVPAPTASPTAEPTATTTPEPTPTAIPTATSEPTVTPSPVAEPEPDPITPVVAPDPEEPPPPSA